MTDSRDIRQRLWLYLLLLGALSAPSFFTFSYPGVSQEDPISQWVVHSYVGYILIIGTTLLVPTLRAAIYAAFSPLAWPDYPLPKVKAAIVIGFCLIVYETSIHWLIEPIEKVLVDLGIDVDSGAYVYPRITYKLLAWFDVTFGVALGAVSEEIFNRVVFRRIIEAFTNSVAIIIVSSSAFFAACHWFQGIHGMMSAFVAGIILMFAYLRMGTIIPSILIHYLMNFWRLYAYYFG